MQLKIAVEPNLTPIKDFLTGKGYQVESVSFSDKPIKNLRDYDAFVVTGLNSDFLGIQNTDTKSFVVNADGMTPEEVAREIERKI